MIDNNFGTGRKYLFPVVCGLKGPKREKRTALAAIKRGDDPAGDATALRTALTFEALARQFLAEAPIAATTRSVYGHALRKDAFPVIGALPAAAVTSDHIIKICKRIEATGAQVQSERTKATIGGVYRWAIRQRLAKANPTKDIGRRSPKVARERNPTDARADGALAGHRARGHQALNGNEVHHPARHLVRAEAYRSLRRPRL